MSGTYGNRPWDRRAEQYRLERQEALGRRGVVFGAPEREPFVTRPGGLRPLIAADEPLGLTFERAYEMLEYLKRRGHFDEPPVISV